MGEKNTLTINISKPGMQEIFNTLRDTNLQLGIVKKQLSELERQKQLAQVTSQELVSYPVDKVWKSCGKTFLLQDKQIYVNDLSHNIRAIDEQVKNLEIKKNYLQTTADNATAHIKNALEKA